MSNSNNTTATQNTATGVFDVNKSAIEKNPAHTETNLYTVDGRARHSVSERTLKKRLAKLASSRLVMILAIAASVSALLSAFRGYHLPFTLFLTAERAIVAVGLWMLFVTAGKKGAKLLAAVPLYSGITAIAWLSFSAVFILCAMFGKLLIFQTANGIELVKKIYKAQIWAVVPILICVVVIYWAYLFYRSERLLLCNARDGLKYGFAFENGYNSFSSGCVGLAIALPTLQIIRGFISSFSQIVFIPNSAVAMLDALLLPQFVYVINIFGAFVQAVVYILAAVLALRYGTVVKDYKAQKAAADKANCEAIQGAEAVVEMEKEKTISRQNRISSSVNLPKGGKKT